MPKRKPLPDLATLQQSANDYARGVLATVAFPLPDLPEEAFGAIMDVITQQLVTAWAAGYKAGRDA